MSCRVPALCEALPPTSEKWWEDERSVPITSKFTSQISYAISSAIVKKGEEGGPEFCYSWAPFIQKETSRVGKMLHCCPSSSATDYHSSLVSLSYYLCYSIVTTTHIWVFKCQLINIKYILKNQLLSHTGHISNAQEPHVASGYYTGQCRRITSHPSKKDPADGATVKLWPYSSLSHQCLQPGLTQRHPQVFIELIREHRLLWFVFQIWMSKRSFHFKAARYENGT